MAVHIDEAGSKQGLTKILNPKICVGGTNRLRIANGGNSPATHRNGTGCHDGSIANEYPRGDQDNVSWSARRAFPPGWQEDPLALQSIAPTHRH